MSGQLPIQAVKTMQAQGMDNNHIVQALQRDGYNSSQIFEALNQATSANSTPRVQTGEYQMNPPNPNYPATPRTPTTGAPQPTNMPMMGASGGVEETVEAIIDEKWNELVKDITMIIEWKNQAQNTIVSMEQQFKDLKGEFDKLHQALIAKIGEYDKNILDVGAEVKAMEKVFSKVLPVFTQNVSELSKITKEMKQEKHEG